MGVFKKYWKYSILWRFGDIVFKFGKKYCCKLFLDLRIIFNRLKRWILEYIFRYVLDYLEILKYIIQNRYYKWEVNWRFSKYWTLRYTCANHYFRSVLHRLYKSLKFHRMQIPLNSAKTKQSDFNYLENPFLFNCVFTLKRKLLILFICAALFYIFNQILIILLLFPEFTAVFHNWDYIFNNYSFLKSYNFNVKFIIF